jgi:hypothetical protein
LLKTERGVRGSWCFLSAQCSFQNRGWWYWSSIIAINFA